MTSVIEVPILVIHIAIGKPKRRAAMVKIKGESWMEAKRHRHGKRLHCEYPSCRYVANYISFGCGLEGMSRINIFPAGWPRASGGGRPQLR